MKISNQPMVGKNLANVDSAKNNPLDPANGKDGKAGLVSKAETEDAAKVNLSENAQKMQKAKEIASEQSVDEAKVARLQKLIDNGEYNVNASALADRLVDEHLLMND